jgi:hypothetical protein
VPLALVAGGSGASGVRGLSLGDSRFRVGVGERIGVRAMVRAMVWVRLRVRVTAGCRLVSVPACLDAISS